MRSVPPAKGEGWYSPRAQSVRSLVASMNVYSLFQRFMLTNAKCNGERPACKACRDRNLSCKYASEPGLTPVAALKRKFESLQAESADEHDLLGFLRTGSEAEAIKVLAYLRSSDDIRATLHQARNRPDESIGLAGVDIHPHQPDQPAHQAPSQCSLQATRASIDFPPIYPELNDFDGGIPWALPIEPYVC
jgi:hypothetical protein